MRASLHVIEPEAWTFPKSHRGKSWLFAHQRYRSMALEDHQAKRTPDWRPRTRTIIEIERRSESIDPMKP